MISTAQHNSAVSMQRCVYVCVCFILSRALTFKKKAKYLTKTFFILAIFGTYFAEKTFANLK